MSRVNRPPGASSAELPGHTAPKSEPKPAYRFGGQLPVALADTREQPRWVAWDYVRKGNHWTKLPINPHTGRAASVSDPNSWSTFDQALAVMKRHDLAGVGLVLTEEDDIAGIDLDDCISEDGTLSALAAAIVGYGETYVEVSPSGKGIRLFALGKIEKAVKDDANGIEIYGTGRYLTVTGQQFPGTPDRIAEASRTLDRLTAVTQAARAAMKATSTGNGSAQAHGSDFFRSLNEAALTRLDEWVPAALPSAVKHANGAWRVNSKDLRRDYQEDLSIHPTGIADFGPEKGLTPIDVMIEYGGARDATTAAMWLCERLGINPARLGWQARVHRYQVDIGGDARSTSGGGQTQAQTLIDIVTRHGVELFHTPDGKEFADIPVDGHRETWSLVSRGFRRWLKRKFYEETGGAPNSDAMSTAMGVIEAKAHYDGAEHAVHLRVANCGARVYLDLCDPAWRAIEIRNDGWSIVDRPPVRFRRTRGMLQIPDPVAGGETKELGGLRNHLHVDDDSFILIVAWLLSIMRGRGPYPILALTGEQGTGKSLLADLLRSLLDPKTAGLRSLPDNTRDLYVAAMNGHVLVFDNLSGIPPQISDCLCRLSTGGGFATRSLYTDDDEVLFDGQRPVALTSITDVANRSDLADRLVIVRLEVIVEEKRRSEDELRKAFEAARPRILGALLDVVGHGLLNLPTTSMNRLPRMADFAIWIRACEEAVWQAGMFIGAYEANREDAVDVVLDSDSVATTLSQYVNEKLDFKGTAKELLAILNGLANEQVRRGNAWPKTPNGLSGHLRRLAPALRKAGIAVDVGNPKNREAGTGRRLIYITSKGESDSAVVQE